MKQIRPIILFSILLSLNSCNGQTSNSEIKSQYSDWRLDLYSPTLDSLKSLCSISSNILNRVQKDDTSDCDLYYLNGNLFTGWTCDLFSDNKHKFRYEQYEEGKMLRRIGYYDNGRLDYDFRMKDCKNYGPSRMWLYQNGMYIYEYYSQPGIKHGIHKRWHDNGILAREAKYIDGVLQYEKEYDRTSKLISQ